MSLDVRAFANAAVQLIPLLTLTLILEREVFRNYIRSLGFSVVSQIIVLAAGVGLIASLIALAIPEAAYNSPQSWPWSGLLLVLSATGVLALLIGVGAAIFRHILNPASWLGGSD